MTLQQLIIEERNKKLIGKEIDVIIDKVSSKGVATGRTPYDAYEVDNITTINDSKGHKPGDIVKVKLTDADAYDFKAVILE
jgi:ribosomal protein S12 methylthiotransferase